MTNQELITQLHTIKTGQPNTAWVERNREILLSQIRAQQSSRLDLFSRQGAFAGWQMIKYLLPNQLVLRALTAVALVIILVLSTSVTTVWADRSLPGDVLYPVKLTSEKVQLSLTSAPEDRAALSAEFAGERLKEVAKLRGQIGSVETDKNIQATLDNYKITISEVNSNLQKVKTTASASTAVAVASIITEQVDGYAQTLVAQQQDTASAGVTGTALQAAIEASNQTSSSALDIIVEKRDVTSPEAITAIVNKKIDQANQKVVLLNTQLKQLTSALPAGQGSATPPVVTAAVTSQINQVPAVLAEAQTLLAEGDMAAAVQKIKQANELIKTVEQAVNPAPAETSAFEGAATDNTVDQSGSAAPEVSSGAVTGTASGSGSEDN